MNETRDGEKVVYMKGVATPTVTQEVDIAKHALSRRWRAHYHAAVSVWPDLEEICQKMYAYVTPRIPSLEDTRVPLVRQCIETAVAAWAGFDERQKGTNSCYREFLKGLLWQAGDVLEWCVYTQRGPRRNTWDPFSEPLSRWLEGLSQDPLIERRERPYDTSPGMLSEVDFRTKLLYTLLIGNQLSALEGDVGYVVGGERRARTEPHGS